MQAPIDMEAFSLRDWALIRMLIPIAAGLVANPAESGSTPDEIADKAAAIVEAVLRGVSRG